MVALLISTGAAVLAGSDSQVYFPTGYTRWTVAKFKFIGPESPNYTAQGGIRLDACHKSQGTRDYVFSDPRR
jgi:hypothetical protein